MSGGYALSALGKAAYLEPSMRTDTDDSLCHWCGLYADKTVHLWHADGFYATPLCYNHIKKSNDVKLYSLLAGRKYI